MAGRGFHSLIESETESALFSSELQRRKAQYSRDKAEHTCGSVALNARVND